MRLFFRSIRGRLMLSGLMLSGIALIIATLSIGHILNRFVQRSLDQSLDAQIGLLLRSVTDDGTVDYAKLEAIGPFTQFNRGWAWSIETSSRTYRSSEVVRFDNIRPEGRPGREGRFRALPERLQSGRNHNVYVRRLEKLTPAGRIVITAAAPVLVLDHMRDAAVGPVVLALIVLSIALLVATLLQLHLGLKPLNRIKLAIGDVRTGVKARIPLDQSTELLPIVEELNDLLDENEAALSRSRSHLANLAHSLKTPLAALSVRLNEEGRDNDGQLGQLVSQIDGALRHHLGRARAASPGAPGQLFVALTPSIGELIDVLKRIYADKDICFQTDLLEDLKVNCDPQDLAEMLGNLMDNACIWASAVVQISTLEDGRWARIHIDDDGPGLDDEKIQAALVPGWRLDEQAEGHGFGLPIARELAELHGGELALGTSPQGGLRATLSLRRGY